MKLSIRYKLLLVIMTLLLIPWMGYQYVREMKAFVLQGQEDALLTTASAVATVLHDRPELFSAETGGPDMNFEAGDLQARQLPGPVRIDGELDDWAEIIDQRTRYPLISKTDPIQPDQPDLTYEHVLGSWGAYLYALFLVRDKDLIYRDPNSRPLNQNDHLRLYLRDSNDELTRYVVTESKPGRMDVYSMDEDWIYPLTGEPVYEIISYMKPTKDGYAIELRIPHNLVPDDARLALAIADVDDVKERTITSLVSTSPTRKSTQLGRVLTPAPEIDRILHALDKPGTRIWVIDQFKRVRAVVGDLSSIGSNITTSIDSNMKSLQVWMDRILAPIYRLILKPPEGNFSDLPADTRERDEEILYQVLEGMPATDRRASIDKQAQLLMAAHPIWSGGEILGAIIVEQSGNTATALQNRLLQNVIAVTVIVFMIVSIALMTFTWRLTRRIRKLSRASGLAISPEGRMREERKIPDQRSRDEIGDLSRSITDMLSRLSHYNRYLESMPDTLAHELNNPLNVVNSSLENLSTHHPVISDSKYMERAQNGVNRLGSLLASLTEAGNLEEALKTEDHERFNLNEMLAMYMEGYQESHPEFKAGFIVQLPEHQVYINGSPDHIAQMLDKLVDNAIDFSSPGQKVSISLSVWHQEVVIKIMNIGKTLPEEMQERLFDPMVSIRPTGTVRSHLGMGLHIVRLIVDAHGGTAIARNNEAENGVVFEIQLPVAG
ncbi:MAG TPA: proteobacterial dedicated sortase system histidine kinase [Gammaproteobacteria bacterium]|nr:proteobacterial dedicated sortase system histidine kinase [Gammaproteobacteria bacterium]